MRKLFVAMLLSLPIFAMEHNNRQLLLCPKRKVTVQAQVPQSTKTCVFCDPEILAQNYIVMEDAEKDLRIMMNKFPYFDFSQGHHLLIMPITHKLSFDDFSLVGLANQIDAARFVSAQLYTDTYSQEYFINLGEGGGQSVPHVHSHIQAFIEAPLSLPDMIIFKESPTNNIDDAYELVQDKLLSRDFSIPEREACTHEDCYCCSIIKNAEDDDKNFVIGRFKHNLVCLAHFPRIAAEIVVLPYSHGHALHDLTLQELLENMTLAFFLLPKLKAYVQENVRQWKGDNIFTKSIGSKASDEEKKGYHVYTSVMPRTIISSPSGTLDGNSCKLDFDPVDLFNYLKKYGDELQTQIMIN